MARAELRYVGQTQIQELVLLCSDEELEQLDRKSGELTRKHYTDGVAREVCDSEWRQFILHLLGWTIAQRCEEILREGITIRFALQES